MTDSRLILVFKKYYIFLRRVNNLNRENHSKGYQCWLGYNLIQDPELLKYYRKLLRTIVVIGDSPVINSAREELIKGIKGLIGINPVIATAPEEKTFLIVAKSGNSNFDNLISKVTLDKIDEEGFLIKSLKSSDQQRIIITGKTDRGLLYGVFSFLKMIKLENELKDIEILNNPINPLRVINHWDNLDGSIERGYAGKSIFYNNNQLTNNLDRVIDYARLLASTGINSIVINNVNVHKEETRLIDNKLGMVKKLADTFSKYGLKTFLSINFASPIELGDLSTADPLDSEVRAWWRCKVENIYAEIPDFGGFLVKADSEHRPGPFTYNRSHTEGANMLAEALQPFGGLLIWRCFVYNCQQDWRDYQTDRARAAYDNFKPLDGKFLENVILQVKNGPMDFQVREPVSPLFGAMEATNQFLELQITQEYTGQQKHLCYLVPQWKEVLDFDTYARGKGSTVKKIAAGSLFNQLYSGITGVVNVGDDDNWTGHTLAQSNLYGFGRLAWDPELSSEEITDEWVRLTFNNDQVVVETISQMLLDSWEIYENYTSPLGIGWMVNPGHHYGPNVDGYEYSRWGTYHRANHYGIGVDRSVQTGTGYAGQYFKENAVKYESIEICSDELLLFFHHVPYTHQLKSGKTVIQHIYDSHFTGVEQAKALKKKWEGLKNKMDENRYSNILARLSEQVEHAREWRDVINSYFYRKSGIPDDLDRKIY